MSKHGGAGRTWHAAVMGECNYICEAEKHDPRCDGFPTEAHHIVYRAHLTEPAMWIRANGIALSQVCHQLAHASHNANIAEHRLTRAVDAVNSVQGNMPGQRISYFYRKGIAS